MSGPDFSAALDAARNWEVRQEGYSATGEWAPRRLVGRVRANSFREACVKLCAERDPAYYGDFNDKNLTVWGCRLFDNEAAARRSFG